MKCNLRQAGVGGEVLFLGRGYTGHEHLPKFGLINMNARLYDPALGRFLSPDPYIQDPTNRQNYNRYSYCLNNPLKYTTRQGRKQNTHITGIPINMKTKTAIG
jgi:RHS repeat-associated protein